MSGNGPRHVAVTVLVGALTLAVVYQRWVWPWQLRWGATDAEVARTMAGDVVVAAPDFVATRAVTIAAPPDAVWPWLVQLGSGRAGWYTFGRIDNAGQPSATEILEQYQHLAVGDLVPMVAGTDIGLRVKELEPEHRMLWWDGVGEYSWEWLLEPRDRNSSRLVTRLRIVSHRWTKRAVYEAIAARGDIIMQIKMLHGIKQRAERQTAPPQPGAAGQSHDKADTA